MGQGVVRGIPKMDRGVVRRNSVVKCSSVVTMSYDETRDALLREFHPSVR